MFNRYSSRNRIRLALFTVSYLTPLILATSCGRKKHHDDDASPPSENTALVDKPMDEETKRWWITKANATLRLGQPMNDIAGADSLLTLTPAEVTTKLTADPAFYDMMADFASYWLGMKSGNFRQSGLDYSDAKHPKVVAVISSDLAQQLQVLNAVKTMAKGGDFFTGLFQENGPSPLTEIAIPTLDAETKGEWLFPNKSPNEIRLETQRRLHVEWPAFVQLLKDGKDKEFCEAWRKRVKFNLGGPRKPSIFSNSETFDFDPFIEGANSACRKPESANDSELHVPASVQTELTEGLEFLDKIVPYINRIEDHYQGRHPMAVKHITDIDMIDLAELKLPNESPLYEGRLFFKLQNSSTNRNRRRASWVLKRFFCDDLTPINVDAPSNHVTGQHGSDPACQSCHYKLDPMAGYFRELGVIGFSFAASSTIFFDDGAMTERASYEKPWKAEPSNGREWNIGYIRSLTDDNQNTFGSNFKDLLNLLKEAPEVKECFVRRAFEYAVGEEQAYDKAWGRDIVARMNETAKTDPNLAIKQVFASIATSKAFTARERNNNVCYDFTATAKPAERAPCRIAAILERNCTSCHNSNSRQGGLDLSTWKVLGDQKPGFPHKSGDKELTSRETFQEIINRLNSSDPGVRMPLMKTMPAPEREELFLWLQKELDKYGK